MLIQIIHNPSAGNADHTKRKVLSRAPAEGNKIKYVSIDNNNWKDFLKNKPERVFVAGGDGTFHKVAKLLLTEASDSNIPLKILPLGTANNIAKTLNSLSSNDPLIDFTIGIIKGIKGEDYFFESIGFGLFPELLEKMQGKSKAGSPEESIKKILNVLFRLFSHLEPQKANIKVNGISIKGLFLLIEIMNTKYIGPNLQLASHGDPRDNFLELVLIPKNKKKELKKHLSKLIEKKHTLFDLTEFATIIRTKKIKIKWKGDKLHIDDNLISDYSGDKITIKLNSKSLTVIK